MAPREGLTPLNQINKLDGSGAVDVPPVYADVPWELSHLVWAGSAKKNAVPGVGARNGVNQHQSEKPLAFSHYLCQRAAATLQLSGV